MTDRGWDRETQRAIHRETRERRTRTVLVTLDRRLPTLGSALGEMMRELASREVLDDGR